MIPRALTACACAALLAACGTAPRESFYTLSALEGAPAAAPPAAAAAIAIGVGPVVVPESVDRTPMVVRTGPNEVDIDDFHRWAEPLKTAIPRVLAENLSRELGTPRVLASRAGNVAVDFRVAVEIQRFDSSFQDGATIDALWTITPTKGGTARTGRTLAKEPAAAATYAAVAAAHSRALARIAAEIAAAMR